MELHTPSLVTNSAQLSQLILLNRKRSKKCRLCVTSCNVKCPVKCFVKNENLYFRGYKILFFSMKCDILNACQVGALLFQSRDRWFSPLLNKFYRSNCQGGVGEKEKKKKGNKLPIQKRQHFTLSKSIIVIPLCIINLIIETLATFFGMGWTFSSNRFYYPSNPLIHMQ